MAVSSWESRIELTNRWTGHYKKLGAGLEKKQRSLLPDGTFYVPEDIRQWIYETVENKHESLSWFYKTYLKDLVRVCVGEAYEDAFYYGLDQMNQFQMTAGWYRRSLRGKGYGAFANASMRLLWSYSLLRFYGCGLDELLTGKASPELYDHARNTRWSYAGILAAQIDLGNQGTIQAVKDILLGEGNTAMISHELIRGIVMSKSQDFYDLLGKFLLAARLQEGARQAVCETMDAGRPEAFLTLFQVIEDHDLVRYSSVKRAVSTWIGIFQEKSIDRITNKLVQLMGRCLREPDFCNDQLRTNDAVAISCALWAKGFYDAEEAVRAELDLIQNGTKHQKMTASYFNLSLQDNGLRMKTSKEVLLQYPEDLELAACFMPGMLPDMRQILDRILWAGEVGREYLVNPDLPVRKPKPLPIAPYFDSYEEAEAIYKILKKMYQKLPPKGLSMDPCIFPWHKVTLTRSQLASRLCILAYMLEEDTCLEEAAEWIPIVGQGDDSAYPRSWAARFLLYRPCSQIRKQALFGLLHNPDQATVGAAQKLIGDMKLCGEDFLEIEKNLRYKTGRRETLAILEGQDTEGLIGSVRRLLGEKSQECRMGALELALTVKKRDPEVFPQLLPILRSLEAPADKEQVLLEELTGENSQAQDILQMPGYGLYDPDTLWQIPEITTDRKAAAGLFSWGSSSCSRALKALDRLIEENRDREYQPVWGDETTLGARLERICSSTKVSPCEPLDAYPFRELWTSFYEGEIQTPEHLTELYLYQRCRGNWELYQRFESLYKKVFGTGLIKRAPFQEKPPVLTFGPQVSLVVTLLFAQYVPKDSLFRWGSSGTAGLLEALAGLEADRRTFTVKEKRWNGAVADVPMRAADLPVFGEMRQWLVYAGDAWKESFAIRFRLDQLYREPTDKTCGKQQDSYVNIGDFVQCVTGGLWTRDMFLKAMFQYGSVNDVLGAVSSVEQKGKLSFRQVDLPAVRAFFSGAVERSEDGSYRFDRPEDQTPQMELAHELYRLLVPTFLKVELRRGESPTPFSSAMLRLKVVCGIDTMIQVLTAMGQDVLNRRDYYWGGGSTDKQTVLSHILKVCRPAPGETAEDLRNALKGKRIEKKRLIELAMYAPQWIDLLEECLEIPGLKSGCYYFMAHTSERLDEFATAMAAKYTPLSPEELQGGAFDVNWFFEAYQTLGEAHFKLLYDACKYSSSGAAHTRARKYADAALGRVDEERLKQDIAAKRNKDLLMSLGLLPLPTEREAREHELLERYQFIEQFRRESRRFGAQRRTAEGKAADLALRNLSVKAGFSDPSRLTLRMETRLSMEADAFLAWMDLDGDTRIRVEVDQAGTARLACEKSGKPLKSLPAKWKKDERAIPYQETVKRLKEQYRRTRLMMEQAMEDRTVFPAWELKELMENPVVRPILMPLVFGLVEGFAPADPEAGAAGNPAGPAKEKWPCAMGFFTGQSLEAPSGQETPIEEQDGLILVHPYDLYAAGCWQDYQKCLFERQISQPFKQVFRELYVKLDEELGKRESRMFAGYQIQLQKTVGVLRGRRWVADYEDGLQKVYYRENIVARIYAMADWFSPSDVEAPTLEYVVFDDRKTFRPLSIGQVPEIIYSEVMRDVDLAVSIAHAGGVDPETSHSTVEMRRAIVACSLELFGIQNVRLEKNHAYIQGRLGSYTVHLGSGVIHQTGNAMIYVVPVHSQHRGRLFLPFLDEDPKTAEILSKVLMFAQDWKIKDPHILEQIR